MATRGLGHLLPPFLNGNDVGDADFTACQGEFYRTCTPDAATIEISDTSSFLLSPLCTAPPR